MSAKVTLLAHTPNPEQVIACAAKLCYSPSDISDIKDGLTPEKSAEFVEMLAGLSHTSPIEHASFTFGVEGISRACSHQLVRHRIASYSQQSQRYVDGNKFDFVTPPEIDGCKKAKDIYTMALDMQAKAYSEIRDALIIKQINDYNGGSLENKTDSDLILDFKKENKTLFSTFEKKANEDARYILPNACCTKLVCTFNARSLQNFFSLRCCNRAQWEIRDVASQMLEICLKIAPTLFKNSGPACVWGSCTEGKMSCGKAKEVREHYREILKKAQADN